MAGGRVPHIARAGPQYAVECQSSYERGAAGDFFLPDVCFLRCHAESARGQKARPRKTTKR